MRNPGRGRAGGFSDPPKGQYWIEQRKLPVVQAQH